MSIKYYYYPGANPSGSVLDRVPLRDITVEEWDEMPADLRAGVENCPFYYEIPPGSTFTVINELVDNELEPAVDETADETADNQQADETAEED